MQPFKGTDFSGRSDYGPFIAVGIPSGGLFTGAEGIKTPEEAAIWGGTAGDQYDPCYHLACDTFDNINLTALDVNSDAVAYAVLQYAMNTAGHQRAARQGQLQARPARPRRGAQRRLARSEQGWGPESHHRSPPLRLCHVGMCQPRMRRTPSGRRAGSATDGKPVPGTLRKPDPAARPT